jgi:hypothetical protein
MALLVLFVLAALAIYAFYVWPMLDDAPANPVKQATASDGRVRTGDASAARPESLEGVLVTQLMTGEITRGQYLRAIEGLAARDDERHPLAVPPEAGPAGV